MATLNIEGKRVTVDDAFLSLSPDEQEATVNEIARQMGISKSTQPSHSGETVPEFQPVGRDGYDPSTGEIAKKESALGKFSRSGVATAQNWLESLPIIGPSAEATTRAIAAGAVAPFSDKTFSEVYNEMGDLKKQAAEENPIAAGLGTVGGAVSGTAPLVAAAPAAFGVTGASLPARIAASGASSSTLAAADTSARGGSSKDIVESGLFGLGIGVATPIVGELARRGLDKLGQKLSPTLKAILKPEEEAARRVGAAITRDKVANPDQIVTAADETVAQQSGIALRNADRGGETTRALARSAANQSPEARAAMENVARDRFDTQGVRAIQMIRRAAGGAADDLKLQQALREGARKANGPAYAKAYDAGDKVVWSPELERLSGSPTVQNAMRGAQRVWRDVAIADGYGATNPGALVDRGGMLSMLSGKVPVFPNLQFWDYTKRIIDDQIGQAVRAGKDQKVRTLTALKKQLVQELDKTVPAYAEARSGASLFFGAEDALESGKLFARQPGTVPEVRRAIGSMSKEDALAFRTGFASEIIDTIRNTPDRTNVISKVFRSQSAREQMELVFGKMKAREIEAYVRVEDIGDRLRGALGNSTTARQLVELGIGTSLGGVGGYAWGGDLKSAATGATAGAGAALGKRYLAVKEAEVMKRVGEMLLSDDPKLLEKVVRQAALSPKYMRALVQWDDALGIAARGSSLAVTQPKSQ